MLTKNDNEEKDSWVEEWHKIDVPVSGKASSKLLAHAIYHLWLKDFLLRRYGVDVRTLTPVTGGDDG